MSITMNTTTSPLLDTDDIRALFRCGKSKALRIIHTVGPIYVGNRIFTTMDTITEYLEEHNNEIKVAWCYHRR